MQYRIMLFLRRKIPLLINLEVSLILVNLFTGFKNRQVVFVLSLQCLPSGRFFQCSLEFTSDMKAIKKYPVNSHTVVCCLFT